VILKKNRHGAALSKTRGFRHYAEKKITYGRVDEGGIDKTDECLVILLEKAI